MNLEDKDIDEVARLLLEAENDKRRLSELVDDLKKDLANKLIDRPDLKDGAGIYRVHDRGFKVRKSSARETWDKDSLARDVSRRAIEGTDYVDDMGEIQGTPEYRVKDALVKAFNLTPRKTVIKKMEFDVDEYCTVEGGDGFTVQIVQENNL